nr:uncharacterized protein LOC109186605 isoform X3 [Ipomoea trifida]
MGCFTACFRRHSKHKRIINSHNNNNNNNNAPSRNQCLQSLLHSHDDDDIIKEAQTVDSIKPIAISKDEEEEELNRSSRKKVTFDLSVKAYEECSNQEEQKKGENEAEKSLTSYPLNHRYQNCSTNGEEEEDLGLEDDGWVQEESSESLFSLSIESRKSVSQPEMPDKEEVSSSPLNPFQKDPKTISGLNQNGRESVLNPIENMSHWKTAKAKTPLQQQGEEKENQNLDWKSKEREIIAVDTSLSSWLVGSEKKKTPNSKNSPESVGNSPSDQRRNSAEEKPVLGAWSHEELKAVSKSSSPRCSSDEIPILGTVGSYWKHTGQATDSDSGSSCRGVSKGRRNINQIPTPFQTRLESVVQDGKINAASNA